MVNVKKITLFYQTVLTKDERIKSDVELSMLLFRDVRTVQGKLRGYKNAKIMNYEIKPLDLYFSSLYGDKYNDFTEEEGIKLLEYKMRDRADGSSVGS